MARQHRWKFKALLPLNDILLYAHKSGRPRVEIDRAQIHHGQDVIWFPGKQKWLPIDISFYHILGSSDVAFKIYQWWATGVIDTGASRIFIGTSSSPMKNVCTLDLLDGAGGTVYRYTMYGCWPSKITPDDLDYTSTKIGEITFTLEMDKATEESYIEAKDTPPSSPKQPVDQPKAPEWFPGMKL